MYEESWLISTLSRSLAFATPLLWGSLGEIYAERAGVINLGLEGMMILGALSAFVVAYTTAHPGLGLLAAAAVGGFAALLHAVVVITLRANQYVSGLALTMLGLGLAGLLGRGWEGLPLPTPLANVSVPGLGRLPILGPALFTRHSIVTYLGLLLAVCLWFVLFYTRWGLIVRSVGEAPAAADALGIRVGLVRYLPAWTEGITAGMGWIALALAIFAAWNPLGAIGGAVLFGALYHLSFRLQIWIVPELLKLMPYVCTIGVLVLVSLGKTRRWQDAPAALGTPYMREEA